MAILRVRKGKSPGTVHAVCDCMKPTLLGRDSAATITLDDSRASRKHSRIVRARGVWILQDLDSRNGTILGGKPIERTRIDEGAKIQIGNTLLTFHPNDFAPPPADEVYGLAPELSLSERPAQGPRREGRYLSGASTCLRRELLANEKCLYRRRYDHFS